MIANNKIRYISLIGLLLFPMIVWGTTSLVNLKVQNAMEPSTVEDMHPAFSWQMQSDVTGLNG